MRQIVLDTETTGLEPEAGHRVIEIGGVELIDRKPTGRHFHRYINPQREVDEGALSVHGITNEFLSDKPLFADVADELMAFLDGAELIIHNAPFDVMFLDYELGRLPNLRKRVEDKCTVVDTLALARHKHPGQKNSLDALCRRYDVDNSQRELHGALLDAEILADVYLMMTGGQTALFSYEESETAVVGPETLEIVRLAVDRPRLRVIVASALELTRHGAMLDELDKLSRGNCVWRRAMAALVG
jgi:DNA polymerase III subunit epsilon